MIKRPALRSRLQLSQTFRPLLADAAHFPIAQDNDYNLIKLTLLLFVREAQFARFIRMPCILREIELFSDTRSQRPIRNEP